MATTGRLIAHTDLKLKTIAVLTDLSETANTALKYAATIAQVYRASLVSAHAYHLPTCAYAAPDAALVYQAFDEVRADLENRLLEQTDATYLRDLKCSVLLRQGEPRELLEDLADVDLIVVGTRGETGLGKAFLGSTAETIFRSSTIPVLTIGPRCGRDWDAAQGPVLYATNFSAGAAVALAYASSIARKMDAELMLLHVVDDKDVNFSFEQIMARAEPLKALRQLARNNIELEHQPKCAIAFGSPDAVILEQARKHDARIIVIDARRSGLLTSVASRFGDGTAYQVAVNAECPVLTIRR